MIYARHITYEHALGICLWGEAGRAMNRRWKREKTDTKVSKSCTRVTRYRELKKKKKRDYNRWVWWGEGWTYRRVLLFVLTDYNERLTGLYLERRGVITWNSTILLFTVLSKHVNLPRELQIFLGQTLHKCLLQVFDTRLVPQQKQCHLPPLHYVQALLSHLVYPQEDDNLCCFQLLHPFLVQVLREFEDRPLPGICSFQTKACSSTPIHDKQTVPERELSNLPLTRHKY